MNEPANQHDASHDFDFFFGHWRAHNRRLLHRLQGSNEWETFEATHECLPLLGGLGNMDELHIDGQGAIGMTIRFFNLQTKKWSLYWVSRRDGILQTPVVGSFSNGIGVFDGPDVHEGQPVFLRFIWSKVDTPTPHWEQALSADNGKTWETNWHMDFTRIKV
jgi:hypothetical protein